MFNYTSLSLFNGSNIWEGQFLGISKHDLSKKIHHRPIFNEFFDTIVSHSFYPQITLPTRFTDRSCTLIDNFFENLVHYKQLPLLLAIKLTPEANGDPNVNYNTMHDILTESMKKHFPIKTVKFNKRKHKMDNEWHY